MSQVEGTDLSDAAKQEAQAYSVATTTEGNPGIPSSAITSKNKALKTNSKVVTLAINELLTRIDTTEQGTVNFADRLNTVVGNETETDKEAWEAVRDQYGGNALNAIVSLNTKLAEANTQLTAAQTQIEETRTELKQDVTTLNTQINTMGEELKQEVGTITVAEFEKWLQENA